MLHSAIGKDLVSKKYIVNIEFFYEFNIKYFRKGFTDKRIKGLNYPIKHYTIGEIVGKNDIKVLEYKTKVSDLECKTKNSEIEFRENIKKIKTKSDVEKIIKNIIESKEKLMVRIANKMRNGGTALNDTGLEFKLYNEANLLGNNSGKYWAARYYYCGYATQCNRKLANNMLVDASNSGYRYTTIMLYNLNKNDKYYAKTLKEKVLSQKYTRERFINKDGKCGFH